ncbi:hypothetical protein [Streptomyces roseochromogenus]|uniref:hypothetical protein n=1 Tax=Streptomyces roseochromogenus TaxID=285450 RepID=UPI001AE0D8DB|nr:hypothetical protein [Streptomyces roseochromogenus]
MRSIAVTTALASTLTLFGATAVHADPNPSGGTNNTGLIDHTVNTILPCGISVLGVAAAILSPSSCAHS